MSARTKFGKLATDGNLLDAINRLERRVAALETRNTHDADMEEADQIFSVDPTGAVMSMVNPDTGTPTYWTDPSTGALMAGGGSVSLDSSGLSLVGGSANPSSVKWYVGADKTTELKSYSDSGQTVARLTAYGNATYPSPALFLEAHKNGVADPCIVIDSVSELISVNFNTHDVDTVIRSATNSNFFKLDAGLEALGIGAAPSGTYTAEVTGSLSVSGVTKLTGGVINGLTVSDGNVRSGVTGNLADDTVYAFTPNTTTGAILIYGATNANEWGWIQYWAGASPAVNALSVGSAVVAGTAVLTDGTGNGTDAKLNVNASSGGTIYIKNRTGGTRNFRYLLI